MYVCVIMRQFREFRNIITEHKQIPHKRTDGYQASKHVDTTHRCKQFTANSITQKCALKTYRKKLFPVFHIYFLNAFLLMLNAIFSRNSSDKDTVQIYLCRRC